MIAGPGARASERELPNQADLLARAAAHLRAVAATPRPAGGPAVAASRRYCADVLSALGFRVTEQPFEYSAVVGELGTPAAGAAVLALIAGAAGASLGGAPVAALGIVVLGGALVGIVGRWAAHRGVLALGFRRRIGVNLEARPRDGVPRVWFVAHIDSKSQPISLVVRAAGIVVLTLAAIAALLVSADEVVRSDVHREWWICVLIAAVIGALPVMASVVRERSPGAIDNASGVATVLAAAELSADAAIGVLITDAEELGLAGARAWCTAASGERVPVFNCDGVDDVGTLTLMWTSPRAVRLERAIRGAADASAEPLRIIPLIPGVLVDGLAFADAGWEAVTLSRGSLDTLRRIHTRGDDLERLRGVGVAAAAHVLARAAHAIVEAA